MAIGERIKSLRKKKGMSARQLAERVGINQQHLYALEAGRFTPSVETARRIAEALDVPLSYLFADEGRVRDRSLEQYVAGFSPSARDFLGHERASDYIDVVASLARSGLHPEDIRDLGETILQILRRHRDEPH